MTKLIFNHAGGGGRSFVEVRAEGHEVWVTYPIKTDLGRGMRRDRCTPAEARLWAEALATSADQAEAAPPEVADD